MERNEKLMKNSANISGIPLLLVFLTMLLPCWLASAAQTCLTSDEMDAATRTAVQSAATRYFDLIARGDIASLKQDSIPSLANNFAGMEATIKEDQPNLARGHATPRAPFLLKAEGTAPLPKAEFLCGVFGASGQTSNSSEFVFTNLPPGTYAVEIMDVSGSKIPYTLSLILQQVGTDWKIGGLFPRPAQVEGHDSTWFLNQANQYKSKGQLHNAWLYYLQGRELAISVPFMETEATDKLYQEESNFKPSDFPSGGGPVDLTAPGGKDFKLTTIFPLAVGKDFDLVVKYQTASVADTSKTFEDNMTVMRALLTKYPELRDAFQGVVVRGVESSGRDYGTMMPMNQIK
jgi:hypothetical protein